jgi:DNA-binding protein HU-beta
MNKQELIEKITKSSKCCSNAEATRVLNSIIDAITQSLKKGEEVTITGFGTFKTKKRASRAGINPKTGEKINIPSMTVPRFKAGKKLKDAVK